MKLWIIWWVLGMEWLYFWSWCLVWYSVGQQICWLPCRQSQAGLFKNLFTLRRFEGSGLPCNLLYSVLLLYAFLGWFIVSYGKSIIPLLWMIEFSYSPGKIYAECVIDVSSLFTWQDLFICFQSFFGHDVHIITWCALVWTIFAYSHCYIIWVVLIIQ